MAAGLDSGAHLLVRTLIPSPAVRYAERGHFRSLAHYDILLGRASALELVHETADGGFRTVSEQLLFGSLQDMQVLASPDQVRRRHHPEAWSLCPASTPLSWMVYGRRNLSQFPRGCRRT